MPITYSVAFLDETSQGAFASGWVVVRHELGRDQPASRVFLTSAEAEAERNQLEGRASAPVEAQWTFRKVEIVGDAVRLHFIGTEPVAVLISRYDARRLLQDLATVMMESAAGTAIG